MTAGQLHDVRFTEIADQVYVLRYPVLDVNVTLVVGDGRALLVDTLSSPAQATELVAAVRGITHAPLVAVNTHHHFDHCFGNAALAALGAPIWAQVEAATALRDSGSKLRRQWYDEWAPIDAALAES